MGNTSFSQEKLHFDTYLLSTGKVEKLGVAMLRITWQFASQWHNSDSRRDYEGIRQVMIRKRSVSSLHIVPYLACIKLSAVIVDR